MKLVWTLLFFWLGAAVFTATSFLTNNFAGPTGTPTDIRPALEVLAIGAVAYLLGLIQFRRRKRG